ncbi:MAG TPA: hypothetical protein VMF57_12255 [Solirubrobacteraceae bacterium]|nr:hypothetical protein [Solirubrobacteraceae bacterium]
MIDRRDARAIRSEYARTVGKPAAIRKHYGWERELHPDSDDEHAA